MDNLPKGILTTLRAEKIGILVKKAGKFYRIFEIRFHENHKKQFAIFVNFTSFKKSKGILSRLTFPANTSKVDKMSLVPHGKLVTHLVKYSHWEDGNAHFSQDGRVLTRVKNLSNPLNITADHIFTVMVQDFNGFEVKKDLIKEKSEKKIEVDFSAANDTTKTLKFTGWWINSKEVHQNKQSVGPVVTIQFKDGMKQGFVFSPLPKHKYSDFILFVSCEVIPYLTKEKGTHLSFAGGFDPKHIMNDLTKDAHFLSFIYPVRGYANLASKIENIDYRPTNTFT